MALSTNLLVVASTAILVVAYQAFAADLSWQEDFTILGTINGKTFMVPKSNETMNAYGAEAFCLSFGLELAMYRNGEEMEFIRTTLGYGRTHWLGGEMIGGRNDGVRGAFQWHDGTAIPEDVSFMNQSPYWTCLYIREYSDIIMADFCINGRHKPLCQTRSSVNLN